MSSEDSSFVYGYISVIKRNGVDQTKVPMYSTTCVCGRDKTCDIRIYNKAVAWKHCQLSVDSDERVNIIPLQSSNPTLLNGTLVTEKTCLRHQDIFTIVDRQFRFEYPETSPFHILPIPMKIIGLQMKNYQDTAEITDSNTVDLMSVENSSPENDTFYTEYGYPFLKRRLISKRSSISGYEAEKKQVTFGPALSPEQFDMSLPSASPLKRGSMPNKLSFKTFLSKSVNSNYASDKISKSVVTSNPIMITENYTSEGDICNSTMELKKQAQKETVKFIEKLPKRQTQNSYEQKKNQQSRKSAEFTFHGKRFLKDSHNAEHKLSLPTNIITREISFSKASDKLGLLEGRMGSSSITCLNESMEESEMETEVEYGNCINKSKEFLPQPLSNEQVACEGSELSKNQLIYLSSSGSENGSEGTEFQSVIKNHDKGSPITQDIKKQSEHLMSNIYGKDSFASQKSVSKQNEEFLGDFETNNSDCSSKMVVTSTPRPTVVHLLKKCRSSPRIALMVDKKSTPRSQKKGTPLKKIKPLYSEILKRGLRRTMTPKRLKIPSLRSKKNTPVYKNYSSISSFATPNIPVETFVSPMTTPSKITKKALSKRKKINSSNILPSMNETSSNHPNSSKISDGDPSLLSVKELFQSMSQNESKNESACESSTGQEFQSNICISVSGTEDIKKLIGSLNKLLEKSQSSLDKNSSLTISFQQPTTEVLTGNNQVESVLAKPTSVVMKKKISKTPINKSSNLTELDYNKLSAKNIQSPNLINSNKYRMSKGKKTSRASCSFPPNISKNTSHRNLKQRAYSEPKCLSAGSQVRVPNIDDNDIHFSFQGKCLKTYSRLSSEIFGTQNDVWNSLYTKKEENNLISNIVSKSSEKRNVNLKRKRSIEYKVNNRKKLSKKKRSSDLKNKSSKSPLLTCIASKSDLNANENISNVVFGNASTNSSSIIDLSSNYGGSLSSDTSLGNVFCNKIIHGTASPMMQANFVKSSGSKRPSKQMRNSNISSLSKKRTSVLFSKTRSLRPRPNANKKKSIVIKKNLGSEKHILNSRSETNITSSSSDVMTDELASSMNLSVSSVQNVSSKGHPILVGRKQRNPSKSAMVKNKSSKKKVSKPSPDKSCNILRNMRSSKKKNPMENNNLSVTKIKQEVISDEKSTPSARKKITSTKGKLKGKSLDIMMKKEGKVIKKNAKGRKNVINTSAENMDELLTTSSAENISIVKGKKKCVVKQVKMNDSMGSKIGSSSASKSKARSRIVNRKNIIMNECDDDSISLQKVALGRKQGKTSIKQNKAKSVSGKKQAIKQIVVKVEENVEFQDFTVEIIEQDRPSLRSNDTITKSKRTKVLGTKKDATGKKNKIVIAEPIVREKEESADSELKPLQKSLKKANSKSLKGKRAAPSRMTKEKKTAHRKSAGMENEINLGESSKKKVTRRKERINAAPDTKLPRKNSISPVKRVTRATLQKVKGTMA